VTPGAHERTDRPEPAASDFHSFVVRLSDALRSITDPDAVMRVSAEALGEELDVDCCGFTRFEPDGLTAVVGNVWNRAGLPGGTRMIERALAAELHGNATLDFAPDGLVCTIDAPMPVPVDNPLIEP